MADHGKIGASQAGYPVGQAPRSNGDTGIKAEVFREREAMAKGKAEGRESK